MGARRAMVMAKAKAKVAAAAAEWEIGEDAGEMAAVAGREVTAMDLAVRSKVEGQPQEALTVVKAMEAAETSRAAAAPREE